MTFTPGHGQVDKFTFNFGDFAGTIYVDDVVFSDGTSEIYATGFENQSIAGWTSWGGYQALSAEGEGYSSNQTSLELTPEEKKDTLTWAMNNWVEGMMKATGGYVTAWDVVNEAISGGGDDGEGFYTLQSAKMSLQKMLRITSTGKTTWVTKTMCALLWLLPVSIMPRMVVLIL